MKKKMLSLGVSSLLVMAMVLSGCGGGGSQAPATTPSESQTVEKGGELKIGLSQVPKNLDPVKYTGTYESNIMRSVFDTLVTWNDEQSDIIPNLAESWTVSDDLKEYTFTLREDVTFHNGRPMVAKDIQYSLERSAEQSVMKRLADLDHAVVLDDYTVKLVLKAPNAAFLARLTDSGNGIVPQEEVEALGDTFGQAPVGTGAYKFESWKDSITLVKNADYFIAEPNLDKVTFTFVPDLTMMGNALISKDLDVAHEVADVDLQKFQNDQNLSVVTSPGMNVYMLCMNMVEGPTTDQKVREAMKYAVDVDAAVKNIFPFGGASRAYAPLPENSWGFDPSFKNFVVERDVEKSKALLAEAGYPDGFDITLYAPNKPQRAKWAEILKAQLAEVGINVTIEKLEWGTYSSTVANNQAPLYLQGWTWYPDPDFFLYAFFHKDSIGTLGNGAGFNSDVISAQIDAAKGTTVDQGERAEMYKTIIDEVMAETVVIPGWTKENISVTRANVHDYKVFSDAGVRLVTPSGTNTWLSK